MVKENGNCTLTGINFCQNILDEVMVLLVLNYRVICIGFVKDKICEYSLIK